ncbi:MAG: OmpA family protein [Desulfamplus sp.]|nr:OmpA family protein [Desulfamplus sp.]
MNAISRCPAVVITLILNLFIVLIWYNNSFAEIKEFSMPESSEPRFSENRQEKRETAINSDQHSQYIANQTQQTQYLVRQFQDRIRENEEEIRFLINEKDWLQNRIYRLQDLNEPVPWEMHNSIAIKEKKIRAAFRENNRLNELLGQERYKLHDEYQNMDNRSMDYNNRLSYPPTSSYPSGNSGACSEALKRRLSQDISSAGLDDWLHFTDNVKDFCKGGDCCVLENTLPILYSSGSARLANEYKLFLKKLAGIIKNHDVRIRIDGFADVNNIHTKQYPSNFELGANRASNIVHELVKNGVSPSLFRIATTGKHRPDGKPMSDNKSLERRSEISIVFL